MSTCYINEIPPEILAQILQLTDYEALSHSRIFHLASVCKRWKEVVFTSPHFWTTLECTISDRLKNGPESTVPALLERFERWFARAGDMPWSLCLSFNTASRKTSQLYQYIIGIPRWRSLSFTLNLTGASNWNWFEGLVAAAQASGKANGDTPCWPQLETLEIEAPGVRYSDGRLALPLQSIAPNLRNLKVTVAELGGPIFNAFEGFPWTNLVHFEFAGLVGVESLDFYLRLLSQAPNLRTLKALDNQNDFSAMLPLSSVTVPIPLTHINLRHLALHDSPNVLLFLKSVKLPSLVSIDLSRAYDPQDIAFPPHSTPISDAIRALVLASNCRIKVLRLKWTPIFEQDLYLLLTAIPTVEDIELDETACFLTQPSVFFERLESTKAPSVLLPNLQRFSFNQGYRCRLVEVGDAEFETFMERPLVWWKEGLHLGEAETSPPRP